MGGSLTIIILYAKSLLISTTRVGCRFYDSHNWLRCEDMEFLDSITLPRCSILVIFWHTINLSRNCSISPASNGHNTLIIAGMKTALLPTKAGQIGSTEVFNWSTVTVMNNFRTSSGVHIERRGGVRGSIRRKWLMYSCNEKIKFILELHQQNDNLNKLSAKLDSL